ncbi:hypothetical protein, partial [Bradyrhizobium sp. 33ap4]|uniref:hypothetical protein n=1 Tax=Bradyrhizobium sp. 33ap4 TaxID=3061630 RepID=UPI0029306BE3
QDSGLAVLGGAVVMCWTAVPKAAGSNPAEDGGNVLEVNTAYGTVCRPFLVHVKDPQVVKISGILHSCSAGTSKQKKKKVAFGYDT